VLGAISDNANGAYNPGVSGASVLVLFSLSMIIKLRYSFSISGMLRGSLKPPALRREMTELR
jgi:hypothetical protein